MLWSGLLATLDGLGELPQEIMGFCWPSSANFARQHHLLGAAELPRLRKGLSTTRNSQGISVHICAAGVRSAVCSGVGIGTHAKREEGGPEAQTKNAGEGRVEAGDRRVRRQGRTHPTVGQTRPDKTTQVIGELVSGQVLPALARDTLHRPGCSPFNWAVTLEHRNQLLTEADARCEVRGWTVKEEELHNAD